MGTLLKPTGTQWLMYINTDVWLPRCSDKRHPFIIAEIKKVLCLWHSTFFISADNGNRTRVTSLGSSCSTIEPYPHGFYILYFIVLHKKVNKKIYKSATKKIYKSATKKFIDGNNKLYQLDP